MTSSSCVAINQNGKFICVSPITEILAEKRGLVRTNIIPCITAICTSLRIIQTYVTCNDGGAVVLHYAYYSYPCRFNHHIPVRESFRVRTFTY